MPEEIITPGTNGIVPPKESTTKPKNRIVPPLQSTKPKPKILQRIANIYSKWSYSYFFIICVVSLFLLKQPNYLKEIFPVLVYVGFIILFVNHLIWANKLGFCKFKKRSTIALVLYFLSCILAVIFNLNLYIYFAGLFAFLGFVLFLFTFKDVENE